ncbi:MAG: hypothetical protein KGM99_18620 [Burkholderiales bacterium]|nr:hypothetical protein [Burkholderiales bacterium]
MRRPAATSTVHVVAYNNRARKTTSSVLIVALESPRFSFPVAQPTFVSLRQACQYR